MANNKNLIPNALRTPEELREMTRKGGIASGVARRAKKSLRERVRLFGELKVNGKNARTMRDLGIPEEEHDILMQTAVSLYQKALKGDVSAFNAIRDILGEKPVDKTEGTMQMEQRVEVVLVRGAADPVTSEDEIV